MRPLATALELRKPLLHDMPTSLVALAQDLEVRCHALQKLALSLLQLLTPLAGRQAHGHHGSQCHCVLLRHHRLVCEPLRCLCRGCTPDLEFAIIAFGITLRPRPRQWRREPVLRLHDLGVLLCSHQGTRGGKVPIYSKAGLEKRRLRLLPGRPAAPTEAEQVPHLRPVTQQAPSHRRQHRREEVSSSEQEGKLHFSHFGRHR
mmetsp:Transcript_18570/g.41666  ORF Transcript_18570/g.41666 Transcript_18570/m.41666 type:complete len:203 (+) Transcript_18570:1789-2397(+)